MTPTVNSDIVRSAMISKQEGLGTAMDQMDQISRPSAIGKPYQTIDTIRERFSQPTAYGGGVSEMVP